MGPSEDSESLGMFSDRSIERMLWNIEDDLLILYGGWLLFMYAREALLGDRAERCYAKGLSCSETHLLIWVGMLGKIHDS